MLRYGNISRIIVSDSAFFIVKSPFLENHTIKIIFTEINDNLLDIAQNIYLRNGIHPSKWTTDPKIIVNKGAYIFGVRATIGLTAKVSKSYAIGRGTGSAIPKDVKNEEILYFILNDMFKKFEQTESGSVYINISKNDFENYRFNIPDRNGLLFFHEKVKPIMDQIYIYKKQNKILQAIKAALLSKIF